MPPKPAKDGLKPSYKYENGYEKFAAIFSADSMRIIDAGQVKSYSREKHGKGLLCNGIFDAKKIAGNTRKEIGELKKNEKWVFMQRVSTRPYASCISIIQEHLMVVSFQTTISLWPATIPIM